VHDAEFVRNEVNRRIAHRDRQAHKAITWGQLDQAISHIGDHFTTIGTYLTGSHWMPDVNIRDAWREVFRPGLFALAFDYWEARQDWTSFT
jgi:hypothetical protein